MMGSLFEVLVVLAAVVRTLWMVGIVGLVVARWSGREPRRLAVWLASEARPFYLPAVVLSIADDVTRGEFGPAEAFFTATALACWFLYKDEGDDRWKKRRKKLAEKVERRGAKLVVVPASGGA